MRRNEIKPGTVYAYQRFGRHPLDPVEPLVFLSFRDFGQHPVLDGLWQDMRGTEDRTFRKVTGTRPVRGPEGDGGGTGYPAVLLFENGVAKPGMLDALRAVTLDDFTSATLPLTRSGCLLLVVTRLARVTGPWEG